MDCIRSASSEALEWAQAMCQGEGANVDPEKLGDFKDDSKKVTFSIYSVGFIEHFIFELETTKNYKI